MSVKLIIFDLSNVCFSNEETSFVKEFSKKHNLNEKHFEQEYLDLVKKAEVDEISGCDVWQALLQKHKLNGDPKEIIEEMMDGKLAYNNTLSLAKKLKDKEYKVVYLTNYSRDYWDVIKKRFDMSKYFSDGIVSYQIKERKPAAKGFLTLMKKIEVKPEETIFIDDSAKNLEGAKALGIVTHQFISPEELEKFFSSQEIKI